MCTSTHIKIGDIGNIKEVQQRLYASIKMGIFDKSNYIVNPLVPSVPFDGTSV